MDDLRRAVGSANQVLVVDGSSFDPQKRRNHEVIADASSPDLIAALLSVLTAAETTDAAIMTPGDLSLVFLRDRAVLGVVVCIERRWIRCRELWDGDARLLDETALTGWIASVTASAG
jgi:hypothetical protein